MTPQIAPKRFVNLGKARTTLPGPDGQSVIVSPFEECLNEHTRHSDATYVLEGDFWARYGTGEYSQLRPFPRPSQYGRTSFPQMSALRDDGVRVAVESADVAAAVGHQSVRATPGIPRLAGDVMTPEGKIRRDLPGGGFELLDDTPENRNLRHSDLGVVVERNGQIRDGIMSWLERMNIKSAEQFAALSDDILLKIPGVGAANLPAIRENIGRYLRTLDAVEQPAPTPVGETARESLVATSIDDVLAGDGDDEEESDEEASLARKSPTKAPAKKKAKKKAVRRKAAD